MDALEISIEMFDLIVVLLHDFLELLEGEVLQYVLIVALNVLQVSKQSPPHFLQGRTSVTQSAVDLLLTLKQSTKKLSFLLLQSLSQDSEGLFNEIF